MQGERLRLVLHDVLRGVCYVKRQALFWLLGDLCIESALFFVYHFWASRGT
jgi:hypothetical protein